MADAGEEEAGILPEDVQFALQVLRNAKANQEKSKDLDAKVRHDDNKVNDSPGETLEDKEQVQDNSKSSKIEPNNFMIRLKTCVGCILSILFVYGILTAIIILDSKTEKSTCSTRHLKVQSHCQ